MRRYYFKRGGKKVYSVPNTLAAIEAKARKEADELGRAITVFYEEVFSLSGRKDMRRTGTAGKVYNRNPVKQLHFIFYQKPDGRWAHAYTVKSAPQAGIRVSSLKKQGFKAKSIKADGETAAKKIAAGW